MMLMASGVLAKPPAPFVNFQDLPLPANTAMTHYWDCCKPSCAWAQGQNSTRVADRTVCDSLSGQRLYADGLDAQSACDAKGAGAVTCPDQAPFFDGASGVWMGFVAVQSNAEGAHHPCPTALVTRARLNSALTSLTSHVQETSTTAVTATTSTPPARA